MNRDRQIAAAAWTEPYRDSEFPDGVEARELVA
jgi:hypothetical protein